jgi:hypothetical protein
MEIINIIVWIGLVDPSDAFKKEVPMLSKRMANAKKL